MSVRAKTSGEVAFLENHATRLKIIWAPFLVATMLLTLGLSGLVGYELGWLDGGPWVDASTGELTAPLMVYFWFGFFIMMMASGFHLVWNLVLGRQAGVFRRRELKEVLATGKLCEATVVERHELSIVKRGARPLNVVVFELSDGQKTSFGAFLVKSVEQFEPGQSVEVSWTPKKPGLAIPKALLP